jgi:hypothetical protein
MNVDDSTVNMFIRELQRRDPTFNLWYCRIRYENNVRVQSKRKRGPSR